MSGLKASLSHLTTCDTSSTPTYKGEIKLKHPYFTIIRQHRGPSLLLFRILMSLAKLSKMPPKLSRNQYPKTPPKMDGFTKRPHPKMDCFMKQLVSNH